MHVQVVGGPFDALRVDLDAFCDVDMNQLGVNVYFPSEAAWDAFTSKRRNSKDFYLDEDLAETNTAPVDKNEANEDPTEANVAPTNGLLAILEVAILNRQTFVTSAGRVGPLVSLEVAILNRQTSMTSTGSVGLLVVSEL
ncbi:hypothetical protein PVK06_028142 [Gossypium arboreum]|uniref:Uncharacterized protein n=1 Tax=Gossypium arboreum TaxID=29729 RepID=A0ABR0P247_GOSAR|nr:hypothetical protein PVK06_028142 [Gossypium arboreum]